MKKLLLISFLFYSYCGLTQEPGIRFYGGVTNAQNRVLAVTPNGQSHAGFHFGADGRINGGKMFFVVGARYSQIDLISTDEPNYFSPASSHRILSGRIGLGWHLINFSNKSSLRGKVLGQLDSNLGYDEELIENRSLYNSLVDASAGAVVGLGVQLNFLTIDVEYEYGLVNVYSMEKETKMDAISVSVGAFF